MSSQDYLNWPSLRKQECSCDYCEGHWHDICYIDSNGFKKYLQDNEIYLINKKNVAKPGCLKESVTIPAPPNANRVNYGFNCSGPCNEFNQFAEANLPNGKFICFSCRKRC